MFGPRMWDWAHLTQYVTAVSYFINLRAEIMLKKNNFRTKTTKSNTDTQKICAFVVFLFFFSFESKKEIGLFLSTDCIKAQYYHYFRLA